MQHITLIHTIVRFPVELYTDTYTTFEIVAKARTFIEQSCRTFVFHTQFTPILHILPLSLLS